MSYECGNCDATHPSGTGCGWGDPLPRPEKPEEIIWSTGRSGFGRACWLTSPKDPVAQRRGHAGDHWMYIVRAPDAKAALALECMTHYISGDPALQQLHQTARAEIAKQLPPPPALPPMLRGIFPDGVNYFHGPMAQGAVLALHTTTPPILKDKCDQCGAEREEALRDVDDQRCPNHAKPEGSCDGKLVAQVPFGAPDCLLVKPCYDGGLTMVGARALFEKFGNPGGFWQDARFWGALEDKFRRWVD